MKLIVLFLVLSGAHGVRLSRSRAQYAWELGVVARGESPAVVLPLESFEPWGLDSLPVFMMAELCGEGGAGGGGGGVYSVDDSNWLAPVAALFAKCDADVLLRFGGSGPDFSEFCNI